MVTPAAHHVEVLQRKSCRIDFRVAGSAGFEVAMLVELRTDRRRAADVRLDRMHACWRWRRLLAEDALYDPRSSQNGGSGRAIGGDFEHGGLGHEATAHVSLWQ